MDKSLKIFIIIVILLAILATVLLSIYNKPKTFKGKRYDALEMAQEYCFKQFPHQYDYDDRQVCMTEFLKNQDLMMKYNTANINWIDKFTTCIDQNCNLEKCFNACDMTILPPVKPERSGFVYNEDFYNALNEWEQILMPAYKIAKNKCLSECDKDMSGTCRKKCCEDAKMCDTMNGEKDKKNCKKSCENVSVKQKCNT